MKKLKITIIVLLLLIVQKSFGQENIITGKVVDSQLKELAMVLIMSGSKIIDTTDYNGNFKFKCTSEIKYITIRFIGCDTETIKITENCNVLEVVLLETGTYDFVSIKAAERKRIRRRNKLLPKLYKEAYERKIFNNKKPCH
ncbi:hypothetical protein OX283_009890 [Flavobacterium sp. SUN052]|uniref:hypothetical protein n=1 Tax=Flavobacterium sp. SUN052 TaxID=3002441 RepID=UPI00237E4FA4|nr:hypothetical protein [Flavobacterium sp. SUN052]MEC4004967.1 hypothetical protein [Flavobacterium sp. SUN052]